MHRFQAVAERRLEIDEPLNSEFLGCVDDVGSSHAVGQGVIVPVFWVFVGCCRVYDYVWSEPLNS